MKNLKLIPTKSFCNFLLLVIILLGSSNLYGQKNAIKGTPLKHLFDKMNVGYERFLNDNWSITADAQFWFKYKNGVDKSFLGSDVNYHARNKGIRSSIELRRYFTIKNIPEKVKHDINFALSGHLGEHHIETTREAYDASIFDPNVSGRVGSYFGEVDIISGGVGLHIGYRILWNNRIFINGELIRRSSWTNYGSDNFELFNSDQNAPTETSYFTPLIKGNTLEPKLSIGFMF